MYYRGLVCKLNGAFSKFASVVPSNRLSQHKSSSQQTVLFPSHLGTGNAWLLSVQKHLIFTSLQSVDFHPLEYGSFETEPNTKKLRYGLNSLRFRGSMLSNTLPDMIKSAKNDRQFKNRLKNWTGFLCCCLICI